MMKKIWKIRKDKSAVSPVIATILMVAITVVLAAVLYVMVMGFGGSQSSTPTGSMTINTAGVITWGQMSPDVKYTDCKMTITPAGGALVITPLGMTDSAAGATAAVFPTTTVYAGAGFNPSANGKISVGDTMTLTGSGISSNTQYTVTLVYIPTGGTIASKTFTKA
jgi:flagellin-like protein